MSTCWWNQSEGVCREKDEEVHFAVVVQDQIQFGYREAHQAFPETGLVALRHYEGVLVG